MTTPDDNSSRVQNTYEYLVAEIMAFRIRTGAQLSENRIAAQRGISRTPVREALQRLEKEGLVRRSENARFTVSQPTAKEASEACDLLEVLDTFVARRAAEKMLPEQTGELLSSVERMSAAAAAGDREAWSAADLAFHRLINGIADNALASEMVKETRRRVQRFWMQAPSMSSRLEECSQEHRVLALAMIDKDYDAIAPVVSEHISHMRERVLDLLATTSAIFG